MSQDRYYIVREDALPEGLKRVARAQLLLMGGKAKTVSEAAAMAGVSRSAFYKYRGSVRPYARDEQEGIITLQAVLENRAGVLSSFLNMVARLGANVMTVNQNIPVGGVAGVTLALNTAGMKVTRESLIARLSGIQGVTAVELLLSE